MKIDSELTKGWKIFIKWFLSYTINIYTKNLFFFVTGLILFHKVNYE